MAFIQDRGGERALRGYAVGLWSAFRELGFFGGAIAVAVSAARETRVLSLSTPAVDVEYAISTGVSVRD